MRREKQRMPAAGCEALLQRAEVLRLGLHDDDGPYVVPVNFGYAEGRIYVHGPREGRRIDAVRGGVRICFEADEGEIVRADRPCDFSSRFASVIGYGRARLIEDPAAKRRALDAIMRHYGSTGEGIDESVITRTSVIEIVIESMDGKWHGYGSDEGTQDGS